MGEKMLRELIGARAARASHDVHVFHYSDPNDFNSRPCRISMTTTATKRWPTRCASGGASRTAPEPRSSSCGTACRTRMTQHSRWLAGRRALRGGGARATVVRLRRRGRHGQGNGGAPDSRAPRRPGRLPRPQRGRCAGIARRGRTVRHRQAQGHGAPYLDLPTPAGLATLRCEESALPRNSPNT